MLFTLIFKNITPSVAVRFTVQISDMYIYLLV